ncbi:MAG: DUF1579 domain-containing protein [Candidatus Krumholzibacteriia bacterium]
MRTARASVLTLTAVALLASAAAFAQTGTKSADKLEAKAMDEMMAMMQPGPEHKQLEKLVGTWKAVNRMWMDPAGPPMESAGTMEYVSVMDGRYVHGVYKGTLMGLPYEGMSIDGYDRFKKQYFSLWFDNMGTGFIQMYGTCSPDGKTTTLEGTMYDRELGRDVPVRSVSTWLDPNTLRYEMFENKNGKELRTMEITYTRT